MIAVGFGVFWAVLTVALIITKKQIMKEQLYKLLTSKALLEKEEAITTLKLMGEYPAGIGDHSTKDFYDNAEEALGKLVDADDKLESLIKYKLQLFTS